MTADKPFPRWASNLLAFLIVAMLTAVALATCGCAGVPEGQPQPVSGEQPPLIPYYFWLPALGFVKLWTAQAVVPTGGEMSLLDVALGFAGQHWPWMSAVVAALFPKVQNNVVAAVKPGTPVVQRGAALLAAAVPLFNSPPEARKVEAKRKARKARNLATSAAVAEATASPARTEP